jgi:transposase
MDERRLYSRMLGLKAPWSVSLIELDEPKRELIVHIRYDSGAPVDCPRCGTPASRYDHRRCTWRHLDSMQYKTVISAEVPRVRCSEHGVLQIAVPWAESDSRFSAQFEAQAIDWLKEASVSAVARKLRISWGAARRIIERAVKRGLERRQATAVTHLAVDEVSFRKRHRYLTIISDQQSGHVLCVREDRRIDSLAGYFEQLTPEHRSSIKTISMDMFPAYIIAVERWIENARDKLCFDKFHVAQYLSRAIDAVRHAESAALRSAGDNRLKGSRFLWLTHPKKLKRRKRERFVELRDSSLKTARAWAIKQVAMSLWEYRSPTWARKAWNRWLSWAQRCRLEPVKKAARQIRNQLYGIINAIVHRRTNARAENINGRIQKVKARANGFRTCESFTAAILFHLGGLSLYPDSYIPDPAHSKR